MVALRCLALASRPVSARLTGRLAAWPALRSVPPLAQPHFSRPSRSTSTGSSGAVSDRFKTYTNSIHFPPATHELGRISEENVGQTVVVHGYLGNRMDLSKNLSFAPLFDRALGCSIQIVSTTKKAGEECHRVLKSLNQHTPVAVTAILRSKKPSENPSDVARSLTGFELELVKVQCLNKFPTDILVADGTVFPPEKRHLQLRLDQSLRDALTFRSRAAQVCRRELADRLGFAEIETPVLFKSTPEGAREFIVPTRKAGMAYALPQSPQQYKQILMASAVPRYFQFAKCFRDEDQRADRQPEFTQLDMEMAFASADDVIDTVEGLVRRLWADLMDTCLPESFPRMKYHDAMSRYGSDKPDTRLGMEISQITHLVPVDMVMKMTSIPDAAVDVMKLSLSDDPEESRSFISKFMDSPDGQAFLQNPDGQPGFCVYDGRKPLQGLQVLGFEAAEHLEQILGLEEGDVVVLQARKPGPHSGGSTSTGRLRLALHAAAVQAGHIAPPAGFSFLWVNDFPLFSPDEGAGADGSGQGGDRGLVSTHHPFTAPKHASEIDLLETDPTGVTADHYDLVVNGVELGGGSRRIHDAGFQEYVLKDVLGVAGARLDSFSHLIEALRAGCPPHAGIALGFDRLMAVMLDKSSVRDVIAFPKTGSGDDPMVKSPTRISDQQLETYHLKFVEESQ